MNPFEEADKITHGPVKEVQSPYIVNRILSCATTTLISAVRINKFAGRFSKDINAAIFNLCVEKTSKNLSFPYPKRKKKQSPKLMQKICEAYKVNDYHAQQILDIIKSQGINAEKLFGLKKGE